MLSFRHFLAESTTLKTRSDQLKSANRKYDKVRTKHILRHAVQNNASRGDTENALKLSKKYLHPHKAAEADPDGPSSERLVKTAQRVVKKERKALGHGSAEAMRNLKIRARARLLKNHGKSNQ